MTLLRSAYRLACDSRSVTPLTASLRRRFESLVCESARCADSRVGDRSVVRLDRRTRRANGGYLLRARLVDERFSRMFWIKWCPDGDPIVLARTADCMQWWRRRNPASSDRVANVLDHWPDEHALLLEHKPGVELGRTIARTASAKSFDGVVRNLGSWMRVYARIGTTDGLDIGTRCGDEVLKCSDSQLRVNAHRLIEKRLALADRAARKLSDAGFPDALRWAERYPVDAVVRGCRADEQAGFIHGDFKPDNVLVNGEDFALIDWWDSPRISWPLPEVAAFRANLWLMGCAAADRTWHVFRDAYFRGNVDEHTEQTIRVLAAMACLNAAASMIESNGVKAWVDRIRCTKVIHRLTSGGGIPHAA